MNSQQDDASKDHTQGQHTISHCQSRKLCLRIHGIDTRRCIIKIKQNQLNYSKIPDYLKFVLVQTYALCFDKDCLGSIFPGLKNHSSEKAVGKQIILTLEDGANLLMKMMQTLQYHKRQDEIQSLQQQINKLKVEILCCQASDKTINQQRQTMIKFQRLDQSMNQQRKKLMEKQAAILKTNQQYVKNYKDKISQAQNKKNDLIMYQNKNKPNKKFSKAIDLTIRRASKELINKSIVGIVQVDSQHLSDRIEISGIEEQSQIVYVIFEQCYGVKKLYKSAIIKLIGADTYLQKIKVSQDVSNASKRKPYLNSDFYVCHHCMQIFPENQLSFCTHSIEQKHNASYVSSDYYHYKQIRIDMDYFKEYNQKHILPFFIYNQDKNGKQLCHRGFCQPCLQTFYLHRKSKKFSCPYCEGACNCQRCELGVSIVKMIAHDIVGGANLEERKYLRKLNIFTNELTPNFIEAQPLNDLKQSDQFVSEQQVCSPTKKYKTVKLRSNLKNLSQNEQRKNKLIIENDYIFHGEKELPSDYLLQENESQKCDEHQQYIQSCSMHFLPPQQFISQVRLTSKLPNKTNE